MAADPTLVQGAKALAQSKIPIFPRPQNIGITAELTKGVLQGVENYQQKIEQNNKKREAQMAEFTQYADAINRRLSTYEKGGQEAGMHEQIYNNTYDYVEELKTEYEQYNTIGRNDTAENKKKRIEILGKLDRIAKSTQRLRADILTIGKLFGSESGGVYNKGVRGIDLAIGQEIINMDGDYSNVTQKWNRETNDISFDITLTQEAYDKLSTDEQAEYKVGQVISINQSDLMKRFKGTGLANERTALIKQTQLDNQKLATGAKLGDKFDYMNTLDRYSTLFGNGTDDDKFAFTHMAQTNSGNVSSNKEDGWVDPSETKWAQGDGRGSWAHALASHNELNFTYKISQEGAEEIVKDLIKAGELPNNVKMMDDGKIDNEEYQAIMTSENRDKVIDALVNHHNPLYDHHLSKNEYAKWLTERDKIDHDSEQRRKQEKQNQIDVDRNKTLNRLNIQGRGSVEIDLLKDEYNRIKTGKRVTYKQKGVTHEFVFDENKKKYISQDGTIEYEKERLRSLLGIPYEMAGVDYPEFQDAEEEEIFDAEKAKKEQEIKLKKEKEEKEKKEKERFDKIMKVSGYLSENNE